MPVLFLVNTIYDMTGRLGHRGWLMLLNRWWPLPL